METGLLNLCACFRMCILWPVFSSAFYILSFYYETKNKHTHHHQQQLKEEVMNLKETMGHGEYMGGFGERKGNGEMM